MLSSEATVLLSDPAQLSAELIDHMAAHDVAVAHRDGCAVIDLGLGSGILEVAAGSLKVRVEARDQGGIEMLRSVMATNIVDFADGETPSIIWSGCDPIATTFANFREVRLETVEAVSPRMRRLTFTGADLDRFGSRDDLHVRLYIPPAGLARPEWPRPGPDGRTLWPREEYCPAVRYYTVRRAGAERVEIDVVLHDDPGPGACFAREARPGMICGLAGPLGRTAPPAKWTLLTGDETALPAIARLLEDMAPDATGLALIEVGGPDEEIALDGPPGMAVRWLHRGAAKPGTTDCLVAAVAGLDWPDDPDLFVWAGCEIAAAKALRRHLRVERGLTRDRHLVVGYWQVG